MKSTSPRTGLRLRRAVSADLPDVLRAYRETINYLNERNENFVLWDMDEYPTPAHVERFIGSGDYHVAHDATGALVGGMVLNHWSPPGFEDVPWSIEAGGEQVLAIHTLVVPPSAQRRGVARYLVGQAIAEARRRGCLAVRLDATRPNVPAHELYRRCGFTDLGEHMMRYEGGLNEDFRIFEYNL